jgi:hypothetical protein
MKYLYVFHDCHCNIEHATLRIDYLDIRNLATMIYLLHYDLLSLQDIQSLPSLPFFQFPQPSFQSMLPCQPSRTMRVRQSATIAAVVSVLYFSYATTLAISTVGFTLYVG